MKPLGDGFIKLIKMIIAPVIFCTVTLGIAGTGDLKKVGKTGGLALLYFEVVSTAALILVEIVRIFMRAAPIGAFGAMAFTIGKYGLGTLLSLAKLMATFYLTCLLFVFIVLGSIAWFHGFRIWKFLKYIREELLIVLGTSSSEAALPSLMAKMEALGVGPVDGRPGHPRRLQSAMFMSLWRMTWSAPESKSFPLARRS
jgi:Na+/H+-dicarboxylate symporter